MKKKLLLYFAAVFLLVSCEYEFAEDYFKEIEVLEPSFSFSLTNFNNGETLRKPKNVNFKYLASDRNKLYEIKFYIDGTFSQSFTNSSGTFFLDIEHLSDNNHILKVEYLFKTSSGSLAEISGTEAYQKIEEFNFNVDKKATPLTINRIENKEGSIFIYFNEYSLVDEIDKSITVFLNTSTLSRKYGNGSFFDFGYLNQIQLTADDIKKGYYKDISTTGLLTKYNTKIQNYYNEKESETKEIDLHSKFIVSAEQENLEKIILTWNQHPLYNNLNTIVFSYPTKGSNYNFALPSVNGGRVEIDNQLYFGGLRHLNLLFQSNNSGNSSFGPPINSYLYSIGDKIPSVNFDKILYNKHNQKIYALEVKKENQYPVDDNVYLHVLNPNTLNIENSYLITTTKGDFGQLSTAINGDIIIDLNTKSIVVNSNTGSVKEEYLGSTYSNNVSYSSYVWHRNNLVFIDNGFNSSTEVFNASTKNKIYENVKSYFNRHTNNTKFITSDAKFIAFKNTIYTKTNSSYSAFKSSNNNADIVDILYLKNKNKLYYVANYGCYEINLITNEVKRVQVHGHVVSVKYNSQQDKLLFAIKYGSFLISLDLQTLATKKIRGLYHKEIDFINDFVIMEGGYYLKNVL